MSEKRLTDHTQTKQWWWLVNYVEIIHHARLEVPFLQHHPMPTWRCHDHAKHLCKGSWGPEVSISYTFRNPSFRMALWIGQFWFGTTLQYGGLDCFHSKVPFRGRYILFGMHCTIVDLWWSLVILWQQLRLVGKSFWWNTVRICIYIRVIHIS